MKARAELWRALAWLCRAGLPPHQALRALAPRHKGFARAAQALEGGLPLESALGMSGLFRPRDRVFLSAGERGGKLADALEALADSAQVEEELKNALVTALMYPLLLLLLAGFALAFLSVYALPGYQSFFDANGVQLGRGSRALFAFGRLWARWWWLVLPLILSGLIAAARYGVAGRLAARIPGARTVNKKLCQARELALFSAALESGIEPVSALNLLAEAVRPERAKRYAALARGLALGQGLSGSADLGSLFTPDAAALLAAGEAGNRLARTAGLAARGAAEAARRSVKRAGSLAEPLLLLLVGVSVGLLIWGLYSPLLGAVETLAR